MARIRTIKPEFPQSESMGRVSREARYCFIMLWTMADDAGRLRGASRMLASLLFPYDDDAATLIDGWLGELEGENCIVRYVADGTQYIQIVKWLEHQKIDKPSPSKIPEFANSSRKVAKPRENSTADLDQDLGSRIKEGSSSEANASAAPAAVVSVVRSVEAEVYRVGREVLGKSAGGMITDLRKAQHFDDRAALDLIEQARAKDDPREWRGAVWRGDATAATPDHILFPPEAYRNVL
jgi:hypothetical protein